MSLGLEHLPRSQAQKHGGSDAKGAGGGAQAVAEAEKLKAETRELRARAEEAERRLAEARRRDLAGAAIAHWKHDSPIHEFLSDAEKDPKYQGQLGDLEQGLLSLKNDVALDITTAWNEHLAGNYHIPEAGDREQLAERVADNTRLIASLTKLAEAEHYIEQPPRSARAYS